MLRPGLVASALAATVAVAPVATARAERQPLVTAKVAVGFAGPAQSDPGTTPDTMTALGVAVSWEDGPMPYPAAPGYATRGELVPELQVMRLSFREEATDLVDTTNAVTAGLRLQLAIAQREMGWMKVTARASAYASGRIGVVADADRTRVIGGALGERFWLGDRYQVGVELDVLRFQGEQDPVLFDVPASTARTLPWSPTGTDYTAVSATLTLGGFL